MTIRHKTSGFLRFNKEWHYAKQCSVDLNKSCHKESIDTNIVKIGQLQAEIDRHLCALTWTLTGDFSGNMHCNFF